MFLEVEQMNLNFKSYNCFIQGYDSLPSAPAKRRSFGFGGVGAMGGGGGGGGPDTEKVRICVQWHQRENDHLAQDVASPLCLLAWLSLLLRRIPLSADPSSFAKTLPLDAFGNSFPYHQQPLWIKMKDFDRSRP